MKHKTPKITFLKKRIAQIGTVLPGRIRTTYMKCGKQNCYCASAPDSQRHGPYFFWDRKIEGKLSSKSLSPEDLLVVTSAIENRKQMALLIEELLELSAKAFVD